MLAPLPMEGHLTTGFSKRRACKLVLLAAVVATSGCTDIKRWAYARGDRDSWQQSERVIESLVIAHGERVADLGSGGGYFTFPLARAVGDTGRVFAVDVDESMNEALRADVEERNASNVEIVQADYDDSRLAPASVSLVFTSNTYHHIEDRVTYFERIAAALTEDGRIAIIDYKPEGFFQRHSAPPETIRSEMESAGYALETVFDYLERQSFQVFGRR